MSSAGAVRFVPFADADLPWIVAQETDLHAFPWTHGSFADSLSAGHACWLMTEAGQPVAYAVVLGVLDEAHLLNLSVCRAAQGGGRGRQLLDHLCDEARRHGASQFFLEVRPSNQPAIRLYERCGFETIGRRKGYYPAAKGREDAIVMRLAL